MSDTVSLTVAARLLGVTRQRVHQLLKAGKIPGASRMEVNGGRIVWCIPRRSLANIKTRKQIQQKEQA